MNDLLALLTLLTSYSLKFDSATVKIAKLKTKHGPRLSHIMVTNEIDLSKVAFYIYGHTCQKFMLDKSILRSIVYVMTCQQCIGPQICKLFPKEGT